MPDPIVEQIAKRIAVELATVTTANGYQFDVAGVIRPTRFGEYVPQDLLVVLHQGDATRAEDAETQTGGFVNWWQEWAIDLIVSPARGSTDPVDERTNQFAADVEKAVMTDVRHNSLALDSMMIGREQFIADSGAFGGARLILATHYGTEEADPYTGR